MSTRKNTLRFGIRFLVIFAVSQAVLIFLDFSIWNKILAGWIAGWIGLPVNGNQFLIRGVPVVIENYCNGLSSAGVLAGVVFALRKPDWKNKLKIFLGGVILLQIINMARVYGVIKIGQMYGIPTMEFTHALSWLAMSAVILGYWYWASKKVTSVKEIRELNE